MKKLDKNGRKHGGGTPAAKIDIAALEQLCAMQCTDVEIAAVLKVSTRTIERKRKEPAFLEAMERGYANGRISIRRAQMKAALAGDRTMLVWLGKQLLGQRDNFSHEVTGKDGKAIEVKHDIAPAVSEYLASLRAWRGAAGPKPG